MHHTQPGGCQTVERKGEREREREKERDDNFGCLHSMLHVRVMDNCAVIHS